MEYNNLVKTENLNIDEFCELNKIPYKRIWYYINDKSNKKKPIFENNTWTVEQINENSKRFKNWGYAPKTEVFKNNKDEKVVRYLSENEFKSLQKTYSLYLKHTNDIYCLDVDDANIKTLDDFIKLSPEFDIFKNCCWIKGNNKGIHIYLKVNNMITYTNQIDIFKNFTGDFLHLTNVWEKIGKNFNGKIQEFDFDNIKHLFNIENMNNDINKPKSKSKSKSKSKNNDKNFDVIEYEELPITEDDIKLVELLNPDMFQSTDKWISTAILFKSVGLPYELFDELSKKHDIKGKDGKFKYDADDNLYRWNRIKPKKYNIKLIHYLAKKHSPAKYEELNNKIVNKQDEIKQDVIKFTGNYLLPEKDIKVIDTNATDIFQSNVNKFFNDEKIKSLSIKAPYGTGKTQFLKLAINTYNPKKILWVSYRKTLTKNIIGGEKFGDEFNFKSYQDGKFDADRLIIQVESLLKLENLMIEYEEGCFEYPTYDLVIIDEIESILNQFQSNTTFKNKVNKETFDFLKKIISVSNKLIVLDGDIGNRTYDYINTFGKSINLVNDIQKNKKTFNIIDDKNNFYNLMDTDINNNKKIVVVCMASTECETLYNRFTEMFENKKILKYTGSSSDKDKDDFNNVDEIWATADILIYSPVCEAGVNFDKEYFDKMYCSLSGGSTSPRGFFQMTARIRQLKETEITCYTTLKYNSCPNGFFTFDEVKNSILQLEGIKQNSEDILINGKLCKVVKPELYDMIYIHNKQESLNASTYYFLYNFELMALNKGHTVNFDISDKKTKKQPAKDDEFKVSKIDMILDAPDIDNVIYQSLLEKQKKDEATQEDKLKINRHYYKMALGVDKLNEEFLKTFDVNAIKKFVSLIDVENISNYKDSKTGDIKKYTDNHTNEEKNKANLINGLIKDLGFNHIFDDKVILKNEFETNLNNCVEKNVIFTDKMNTKIRFNLNKNKIDNIKSTKGFLGFINSLFDSYYIKISYKQVKVKGVLISAYYINLQDGINELLEYKIRKGYKLIDTNNIRIKPTKMIYEDLIDLDKLKEIEKEREERILLKKKREEQKGYNFGKLNINSEKLDDDLNIEPEPENIINNVDNNEKSFFDKWSENYLNKNK